MPTGACAVDAVNTEASQTHGANRLADKTSTAQVENACLQAVALAPDNGHIRDSRGLNRALRGDTAGALKTSAHSWCGHTPFPMMLMKRFVKQLPAVKPGSSPSKRAKTL